MRLSEARDPGTDGFVMLDKTFKGLTDQMLSWQTQRLQTLAVGHDLYARQLARW